MFQRKSLLRRRPLPPWSGIALPLWSVVLLLSACGPRPPWPVRELAPSPVPPQKEEAQERCAQTLTARQGLQSEQATPADPTNFGERQPRDVYGRKVPHAPQLIVLHETVVSEADTLRLFRTPHPRDADQASYHLLISPQGERLRLVDDGKRAYGAGMSAWGDMSVRIRPTSVGSINNVALHLGLVSPPMAGATALLTAATPPPNTRRPRPRCCSGRPAGASPSTASPPMRPWIGAAAATTPAVSAGSCSTRPGRPRPATVASAPTTPVWRLLESGRALDLT